MLASSPERASSMRKLLIASPHFPPVNAADHQRIRMALPYFKEFRWDATVLTVNAAQIEGMPDDPHLSQTVPKEVKVERAGALHFSITRPLGLGSLAIRALPFLWRKGCQLLVNASDRGRRFDLVFFSTTQFPVMILGPIWKRRFGIPYVTDSQDPWLDDYYERTRTLPPGGRLKYALNQKIAQVFEPRVMREVSQVISVSPAYVRTLQDRYPHLHTDQLTVLPFGAPEHDFELLPHFQLKQSFFDPTDGKQHWLYIGAAGPIMEKALRLLFSTLARLRSEKPEASLRVQLHFVGTSYAPSERAIKTVEPVAGEFGLKDLVDEQTARLPYFEALQALTEADALLVIGSDSPSYSASKLYPYMLAKKPLLAVLHRDSPAVEILCRCNAGEVVTFDPEEPLSSADAMKRGIEHLRDRVRDKEIPKTDECALANYSAREMTRQMCAVFDRAITKSRMIGQR
jgi:hypothetical protein